MVIELGASFEWFTSNQNELFRGKVIKWIRLVVIIIKYPLHLVERPYSEKQ